MQKFKKTTLKNGLQLIAVPMQGTKTATVLVIIGTGSKYETRENNGISHFLEHLFFKGTKKRPTTLAISQELDSIGAEFNAFTGKEYTGYWVKADAGKIEVALDVVSDMLLNSRFPAVEIEREKGVILEEINMYEDNPMIQIEEIMENSLYGDSPAGWDTIGTKKNVQGFKREDFIKYLKAQYSAHNTFICLTGDLKGINKKRLMSPKSVERLVSKYFSSSDFNKRGHNFKEKLAVVEKQLKPAVKLKYKKTDQVHLSLGVRTYGYAYREKVVFKLLAIILGGSMSSRMFIQVRERRGLAYYVRTQTEHYSDTGYLTTRAGVTLDKVELALKTILQEYKKIKKILVSAKELQRTKDLLRGRVALQLEASDNQADWYARQAVMIGTVKRTEKDTKMKVKTPEEYIKAIDAVTSAQIRELAKKIFVNKNLNLAIIGQFKDKKRFEKLLKI